MNKNEKLERIKNLTKQVIHFGEQNTSDKLSHFIGGKGIREIYHGQFQNKSAYFAIYDNRLKCFLYLGVELNTDFLSKWRKFLSPPILNSKFKNIAILNQKYLAYMSYIEQIPIEPMGVEELICFFKKLYQLARDIESNQKTSALATITQIRKMQFEEIDLWGKG